MKLAVLGANLAIFSAFQIYLIFKYFKRGQQRNAIINLAAYFLVVFLLIVQYSINAPIPLYIVTCSLIAVIGHTFVGTYLDVYHKSKYYDRYLHLFGSFSFSILIFYILNAVSKYAQNQLYTFLFVFAVGTTIGVFLEFMEFMLDTISKKPRNNQHGLTDTNFDMIFNVVGSFIAGIVVIVS